jgi:hypothetical protein
VKATIKLLESLARNDAVAEQCSSGNSVWLAAVIWSENYQQQHTWDIKMTAFSQHISKFRKVFCNKARQDE